MCACGDSACTSERFRQSEKDAEIRSIFSCASADPAFYRTEAARDFRRNRLYVCSVYPQASSLFYAGQLSDCNDKRK